MCKAKIFPGVIPPNPRLNGSGGGGKERDIGVEQGKGEGGKGSAERGEERRGRERTGGNERRKVGWGVLLHALRGDRRH
jgi:hypothetical protein